MLKNNDKNDTKMDGLLIIVDDIGLPILTREYGDIKIPPSAAIGIVSAIFHACTNGTRWNLRMMESNNRRIHYKQFDNGLLYIFINQKPNEKDNCSSIIQHGLDIVNGAVELLCGRGNMKQLETSHLKSLLMHNMKLIDSLIRNMYTNIQLIMDQPVAIVSRPLNSKNSEEQSKLLDEVLFACCLSKGTIYKEYISRHYRNRISSRVLVLICFLADCLLLDQVESAERLLNLNFGNKEIQVKSFFQKEKNDQISVCIVGVDSYDQQKISSIMEWIQAAQTRSTIESWNILPLKLLSKLPFGCVSVIALRNAPPLATSRIHIYSMSSDLLRDFQIQIPIEKRDTKPINLEGTMSCLRRFATRTFLKNQELELLDYSETDESYVYHHCRRGPFQFYTQYLCAALIESPSLDCEQLLLAGDVLHDHFLFTS